MDSRELLSASRAAILPPETLAASAGDIPQVKAVKCERFFSEMRAFLHRAAIGLDGPLDALLAAASTACACAATHKHSKSGYTRTKPPRLAG